ncbi:MAG TPA: antibiotic biosynthesis monooxygenase [Gemmatimonadales bacterium]
MSAESRAAAAYVSIWVYRVRPEALVEFVRHYSSGGAWARLFGQAAGYRQTRLLADPSDRGRYVTIDEWDSAAAYCEFRARWQPRSRTAVAWFPSTSTSKVAPGSTLKTWPSR